MTEPDLYYEQLIWDKGHKLVAGLDEVGKGSFAGPVVAGAVVFAPISSSQFSIPNEVVIRDSKTLSEKRKDIASEWIIDNALTWGIGEASVTEINTRGITPATSSAFRRAVDAASKRAKTRVEYLLIDAMFIPSIWEYPVGKSVNNIGYSQAAIPKGDSKSLSIAAASIIAKVYRDKLMKSLSTDPNYLVYEWQNNKGYGTKLHRDAIGKHGACIHHRTEYIKNYIN